MKKLSFALLFFTAIAWLWIGHMMGADTVYQRVGGNTVISGELGGGGSGLTNGNVNSFVIFTNNGVSMSVNASGIFTLTNYAAAGLGFVWSTNGSGTNTGNIQSANLNATASMSSGANFVAGGSFILTGVWTHNTANMRSGSGIYWGWSSAADNSAISDTVIRRNAAGQVAFGAASTGLGGSAVAASLIATNTVTATNSFLLPTNYVAANFTPVAGMVKIVSSNGVLYKVTQLSTNLLGPDTP